MKQKTKVVEIDGTKYQIRRFLPDVGSYLLMRIIGAGIKGDAGDSGNSAERKEATGEVPSGEELARAVIFAAFLRGLDFDTHQFVQQHCMQVCARLEGPDSLPMPLVNAGGVWAIKDVQDDTALVMRLQVEALTFNFTDFFATGGLNALAGAQSSRV
jgi:hypothetical protein